MKSLMAAISQLLFTFLLYICGILVIGLAIFPGVLLCYHVWIKTAVYLLPLRMLFLCFAIASAYFIYGLCLILIAGILRFILRLNLKEAEYHIISIGAAKWVFVNALYLLISVTFMDFVLLTPLAVFCYRFMGAKVGRNVHINTKYCADLSLLEIGDGAVIGGHATVIGHSFERNRLILKKVKIGKNAIIGLNSVVLPGAEIGDGALVAAGSIVGKNTKVEPRSVYSGGPAESAKEREQG